MLLSCAAYFCRCLVLRVVCVVLVRQFGFRRFVVVLFDVWVIRMIKHIRSSKCLKSNHGRQYAIKLKSYIL